MFSFLPHVLPSFNIPFLHLFCTFDFLLLYICIVILRTFFYLSQEFIENIFSTSPKIKKISVYSILSKFDHMIHESWLDYIVVVLLSMCVLNLWLLRLVTFDVWCHVEYHLIIFSGQKSNKYDVIFSPLNFLLFNVKINHLHESWCTHRIPILETNDCQRTPRLFIFNSLYLYKFIIIHVTLFYY